MAFPQIGYFLLDSYQVTPGPLMRRSDMESGPPKQARIAPKRSVKHACAYQYTAAEYLSFKSWVDTEGAQSWFDWIDPFDGSTLQAQLLQGQYAARPVKTGDGQPLAWQVTFTLETYQ